MNDFKPITNVVSKEDIIKSTLNCEPLNVIIDKCALFLGNPLVLISETFAILAHSTCIEVEDDIWNNAMRRGYVTLDFGATLNNWNQLIDPLSEDKSITITQINTLRRKFYQLRAHKNFLAYLNIVEAQTTLDVHSTEDYEFVTQVLAKELLHVPPMSHENQNEKLLIHLDNDKFEDFPHYQLFFEQCSFVPDDSYYVLCIDLSDYISYNAYHDNFKDIIRDTFPHSTTIINHKILSILISKVDHHNLITLEQSRLYRHLLSHKLTLGCSDIFQDLYQFLEAKTQAIKAYQYNHLTLGDSKPVNYYDQIKNYVLLETINGSNIKDYCSKHIWTLYEYDKLNTSSYLKTFYYYLQYNHSVKETSIRMFLHRNTISYRIKRTQELLDLPAVFNQSDAQLILSCQMIQMLDPSIFE